MKVVITVDDQGSTTVQYPDAPISSDNNSINLGAGDRVAVDGDIYRGIGTVIETLDDVVRVRANVVSQWDGDRWIPQQREATLRFTNDEVKEGYLTPLR